MTDNNNKTFADIVGGLTDIDVPLGVLLSPELESRIRDVMAGYSTLMREVVNVHATHPEGPALMLVAIQQMREIGDIAAELNNLHNV